MNPKDCAIKETKVWITRSFHIYPCYEVFIHKPVWQSFDHLETSGQWRDPSLGLLTSICARSFKKFLGFAPPRYMQRGGEKAIMKCTLFTGLRLEPEV